MKVCDPIVVFLDKTPDFHGMALFAVKGPIHEFHLGDAVLQEKGQLPLHPIQAPKPHRLINRRKTVAAGKGASPAALIVDNPVLHSL